MFVFELERGLFRFTLNTPAFEVLFQLPPQIGKRYNPFPTKILNVFYIGCFHIWKISAAE